MIRIPSHILKAAFAPLSKCIGTRTTLPVLSYLRVERVRHTVTLTATNLDQWLTVSRPLENEPQTRLALLLAEKRWAREAQVFLVPRSAVRDAIKAAGKGDITLEPDAISYDLAGSPVRVPFEPLPVDEFPKPPPCAALRPPLVLDAVTQGAILAGQIYSSDDETRYILNGVYLDTVQSNDKPQASPCIVATDGCRLFRHMADALAGLGINAVVPTAALDLLGTAALMAHPWTVQPFQSAVHYLHFTSGPWALTTKLVDGNFPNYRQVIPHADSHIPAILGPEQHRQLCEILDRLPSLGREKSSALTLGFHPDRLELHDASSGITAFVPGVLCAAPIVCAFDRKFFRDLLRTGPGTLFVLDDRTAMLYVSSATGGQCGPLAQHVLMPLRLDNKVPVNVPPPAATPPAPAEQETAKVAKDAKKKPAKAKKQQLQAA